MVLYDQEHLRSWSARQDRGICRERESGGGIRAVEIAGQVGRNIQRRLRERPP